MAQTPPPTLTAPPTAPSRADPANFATRGDAFLGWFATAWSDLTATLANVYGNAVDAYNNALSALASATSATSSASAAQASAQAAAAGAGAVAWVSGTTYAIGDLRWSPADYRIYRRKTAGAGTTDPSADATNWALAGTGAPQLIVSTSTANAASAHAHIVLTNASASTVTLPAAPLAGDVVWVTPGNGRIDNVVARNGQNIMSLAEDMTLDNVNVTVCLLYINSTLGWRLV